MRIAPTQDVARFVAVLTINAALAAPTVQAAGLGGLFKKKKKTAEPSAPVELASPGSASVPEINVSEAFKSRHNNAARKALGKGNRVAVAGFRVAFNTRGQAHASTDSRLLNLGSNDSYTTDSSATMIVELAGVSPATFHAVAQAAYDEFLSKLKSAGVAVVPLQDITSNAAFQSLEKKESPYHRKKKLGGSQEFQIASAPGIPLFFQQGDVLLQSAGSAFNLKATRALSQLSADLDAVVVIPTITLDFAKMTSSGRRKMLRKTSEVGASPEVAVRPGLSTMNVMYGKTHLQGEGGAATLRQGVTVPGGFGEMTLTKSRSNKGLVTAMNLLGAKGGSVSERTEYTLTANEASFQELTAAGAKSAARAYAGFIAENLGK